MKSIIRFVACVFCVNAFGMPDVTADEDGFAMLDRAAKGAPSDEPESDAPLGEAAKFLERGRASWDLCVAAVDATIHVPSSLDVVRVAEFRPLFRLLVTRARYALRKSDMQTAIETLRVLFGIARAFADADFRARSDGFIADVYLTMLIDEAASKFDRESCERASALLRDYLQNWSPIGPKRAIEQERRKIGDKAVLGEPAKARAAFESRAKLYQTIYKLLAVKLDIRRHQLDFTRLPDRLNELKGTDTVDPYSTDGGPFRYRVGSSGYTIYSVGPDGNDDGGERRSVTALLGGMKGDLVF